MRTQPMTAMVTRPTAVFVGQGASLPLAPGATVTLLGQPTGRVVAARTRGGVEGYIPTNDIEVSSTGWPALAGLLGLGVVTPMRSFTPSISTGSGWRDAGPGGSRYSYGPTRVADRGGVTQDSVTKFISSDSFPHWLAEAAGRPARQRRQGYQDTYEQREASRARYGSGRYTGASVPGLFGLADDVLPSQLDDTEGFLSGGFLRGLLKLAVPIIVIGAGVALGHRWAGIRSQNRRRRNRGRRRNPPYQVKGITTGRGARDRAQEAYDKLDGGYRSLIDLNKGSGFKSRKVLSKSGRQPWWG